MTLSTLLGLALLAVLVALVVSRVVSSRATTAPRSEMHAGTAFLKSIRRNRGHTREGMREET